MPASRHLSTLLTGLAVAAGVLFATWTLSVRSNGPMRRELAQIAGPESLDCGMVRRGQDRSAAVACTDAALRGGKPFRVAFEVRGIDSRVMIGLARKAGSPVMQVLYDADSAGGNKLIPSPATEVMPCSNPAVSATAQKPFTCG